MKVYVNEYDYNKKFISELNYDVSYSKCYLYTTDGMYLFHHNTNEKNKNNQNSNLNQAIKKDTELKKIEYTQNYTENCKIDYKNHTFLIDNSTLKYSDSIFHIPYFHLYCEEINHKKSVEDFYFIKTTYFDQVDYYFETDRIDDALFEKMITFLSSN